MHILFVTGTYYPSTNGVAISLIGYKKEIEKRGHKITVLAPNHPGLGEAKDGVIRYPSVENRNSKDYPIPLLPGIRSIYKLLEGERPDIIHVHHPFLIGYFAKLLALHYKAPLVFTYHTNYDIHAQEYLKFIPAHLKKKFVENSVYEFCEKVDLVVAPSKFIEKRIKKKTPNAIVRVIPTPVFSVKRDKRPMGQIRKDLLLPSNKKLLLTVSRIAPEKNVGKLIDAMQYLPGEFCLVIVGDGQSKASLRAKTRRLGLAERVLFVGKVSHKEVGKYYSACDAFVFASESETQGLIFFEASFVGIPIIAADSDAAREFVSSAADIIAKPNPRDLARGVLKVFRRRSKTDLVKVGSNHTQQFSKQKLVSKLLKSYKELLKKE